MQSHLVTERQNNKASKVRNSIVLTADFDQQWKSNFLSVQSTFSTSVFDHKNVFQ